MSKIHLYTAMLFVTAGLAAGSVQADGPILGAAESFSLTRTDTPPPPPKPVAITMVHDDLAKKWIVSDADVQKAATYLWKVDALCHERVKTLTVGFPGGGQESYTTELQSKPAHLIKEKSLVSFDPALLRQRCLDVATGSTQSGSTNDEKQEIAQAHKQFVMGQSAVTWVNGATHNNHLALSGTCTTKDGSKTTSSVSGKKFSTEIRVNCCLANTPACETP